MKKGKIENNSKFLTGALILLIAGVICKFLGAFYRIPLSNILGAEGIGVYQLVFPIYSLFLIVSSGGIPAALSKSVAECRARNETSRAKRFVLIAFVLSLFVSSIFCIIFFVFNNNLAILQGNIKASLGYLGISVAIVFASLLTAFRGYFQGYQNMMPTAISQIIEQVGKLVLGLVLAKYFFQYGLEFGVFGALLGISISEIVALIYLSIAYFRRKKHIDVIEPEIGYKFWGDVWLLVRTSFPITLNSVILPLILALDSFLVVKLLINQGFANNQATALFGLYSGMVNSLINFPTVVSLAISVSLIPAISYNKQKGGEIENVVSTCVKIVLLISIPCFLVYVLFSTNIITILYPHATNMDNLKVASLLLKLSAINILFISFLQISTSIMQALSKSFLPLINLIIAGCVKIVLIVYLVNSPMNIYGAAIASLVCYAISAGLNLITLKDYCKFKVGAKPLVTICLASLVCVSIMVGFYNFFRLFLSLYLSFIFSLIICVFIYLVGIFMFPVFSEKEIENIPLGKKIKFFGKSLSYK